MGFVFCPYCGERLHKEIPAGDNLERDCCAACGSVHYCNPRILVALLLYCQDKILWIQRAQEPDRGLWALPAGFLEMDESLQEAAVREFEEETGVTLVPDHLAPLTILSLKNFGQVYISFRCRVAEFVNAELTGEILDWGWFSEGEVPWGDIAHTDVKDQARLMYRCLREGNFPMTVGTIQSGAASYHRYEPEA